MAKSADMNSAGKVPICRDTRNLHGTERGFQVEGASREQLETDADPSNLLLAGGSEKGSVLSLPSECPLPAPGRVRSAPSGIPHPGPLPTRERIR